jgi:hypothetical protein
MWTRRETRAFRRSLVRSAEALSMREALRVSPTAKYRQMRTDIN